MSETRPDFTPRELDVMAVLWEHGPSTVRQVHDRLEPARGVGYTTVLKLMQIMFEKGLVKRDDSAKTHIYHANVSRDSTQKQMVGKMVNSLFGGNSTQLVMQALGNATPSKDELDEIQKMLDNLKNR